MSIHVCRLLSVVSANMSMRVRVSRLQTVCVRVHVVQEWQFGACLQVECRSSDAETKAKIVDSECSLHGETHMQTALMTLQLHKISVVRCCRSCKAALLPLLALSEVMPRCFGAG